MELESNDKRPIAETKYYFLPKTYYLWFPGHIKYVKPQYDSDGMVKLSQKDALTLVTSHIREYTTTWLKMTKEKLHMEFERLDFAFHSEIKQQGYCGLKPQPPRTKGYNIREYMKLCELEWKMYKVCKEIGDPINILFNLLSPFSQLSIPLSKEDCTSMALSTHLCRELRDRATRALEAVNEPNCDRWLEAWQVFSLLQINHTAQSEHNTEVLFAKYQAENMIEYGCDPVYRHYFSFWLESCKLLRSGNYSTGCNKIINRQFHSLCS